MNKDLLTKNYNRPGLCRLNTNALRGGRHCIHTLHPEAWEIGQGQYLDLYLYLYLYLVGGKVLVIVFRRYITSYGLQTLCDGPETLAEWKSVTSTGQMTNGLTGVGARDAYASDKNASLKLYTHSVICWPQSLRRIFSFHLCPTLPALCKQPPHIMIFHTQPRWWMYHSMIINVSGCTMYIPDDQEEKT